MPGQVELTHDLGAQERDDVGELAEAEAREDLLGRGGATEDRAAYARQYYNDAVLSYNNAVTTVPQSIFAAMFNFRTREYFQAGGEERGPVRVQF